MTERQFYDWQTAGGGDDVLRLVETLEREETSWCEKASFAVDHWAEELFATADVDIAVAGKDIERAILALENVGFSVEEFEMSMNLRGSSKVNVQISTEEVYQAFPERGVPADVHGILLRVASLPDTPKGKLLAYRDDQRRPTKRQKDLLDIMRLVESHPQLETASFRRSRKTSLRLNCFSNSSRRPTGGAWTPSRLPLANSYFCVGQALERRPQEFQIHPNRKVRDITHKLQILNRLLNDLTCIHRRLDRVHQ